MADIKDHPNAVIRRELELLRARVEYLETAHHMTAKAVLGVNQNQRELQELLLKTNQLMALASGQFSELLALKNQLQLEHKVPPK